MMRLLESAGSLELMVCAVSHAFLSWKVADV
jgi:hypothetical protein